MTEATLKIIADAMQEMGLRYGLMEYNKKPVSYPYFVGEYTEETPMNEDGMTETTFQLTGYSRTTWKALEDCKTTIAAYFDSISGKTMIAANGSGVAIFYEYAHPVPTWDEELKKIMINLRIKEWKVN